MGSKHRSVIGIDPGNTRTGWAVFWEAELQSAGWLAGDLFDLPDVPLLPAIVVVELPVIYPLGKGKGDPNDLIKVAELAGAIRGFYSVRAPGVDTAVVKPRTWKGTVPKAIHNKRVVGALSARETNLLPRRPRAGDFDHNMLDAIGIGLWQLAKEGQRE